ncbi:cyclase family protein [bacterium]|nr:cyclase family protein [bacterium]
MKNSIPEPFQAWPKHTGNWGRWPDNDRGALNLITPEAVMRGIRSVKLGLSVPCARPIAMTDPNRPDTPPAAHEMVYHHALGREGECNSAGDRLSIRVHGMLNTHIDAFSHVGFRGFGYDGIAFDEMVDPKQGASRYDITDMQGIVTRGVFVDVARARGVRGLEPGDCVLPQDIAATLERLQPGDAMLIRTGVTLTGGKVGTRKADGSANIHYPIAGLHADCIDLLASRDISILASDSPSDTYPSPVPEYCESPVHRLCLTFWGIPLVHNMDLEKLGDLCAETGRDDFLFMVSALNFARATGSPCTPVAVL